MVEQRPFRGLSEFKILPRSDCSSSLSVVRFWIINHYLLFLLPHSQAVNVYGAFLQIKKYIPSRQTAQMWPLCAAIWESPSFLQADRAPHQDTSSKHAGTLASVLSLR